MYSKIFLEHAKILVIFFLSSCTLVVSFDNEMAALRQPDYDSPTLWHLNSKNAISPEQVFDDSQNSWKRANIGFTAVRGKKPSSSAFFGMRGKKAQTGFFGVRGKKMDHYLAETQSEYMNPHSGGSGGWNLNYPNDILLAAYEKHLTDGSGFGHEAQQQPEQGITNNDELRVRGKRSVFPTF